MKKTISRRRLPEGLTDRLPPELHRVLRRVYLARNLTDAEGLARALDRLHPIAALNGMSQAVELLHWALSEDKRILVVADFDADGATSCAVAMRALRAMGASEVDFLVPNRFEYGYGLTPEIVAVAQQRRPDLLITVDNGISSVAGVAAARQAGMRVLITDHHLPGETLPQADAIVNPNLPGDAFPSKHLAGVGVVFYVMMALRSRLREQGWFEARRIPEPNLARFLDLVALGTVADVVRLDRNNRILVAQGLARIRQGHGCAGIEALVEVSARRREGLVASDLAFALAPRLNAAGRLEDMSIGIRCLSTDDPGVARSLAQRLDALNRERRAIGEQMEAQARSAVATLRLDDRELPLGVALYGPDWHQGVIGVVASRLKDQLHRPVVVFADAEPGTLKGSARSIEGFHIRDALEAISSREPGLIRTFGGHAMAAGLTVDSASFAAFERAFAEEVGRGLRVEDTQGVLWSDGELRSDELTLELAEILRAAGPWGAGFPEPLFDGEFELRDYRVVGERHLKLSLALPGANTAVEAIAFNADESLLPTASSRVQIAYRLDVNEYRGRRSPQLIVEHIDAQPP